MRYEQIVALVLLLAFLPNKVYVFFNIWKHRSHPLIHARGLASVMIHLVSLILMEYFGTFRAILNTKCGTVLPLVVFATSLSGVNTLDRLMMLYVSLQCGKDSKVFSVTGRQTWLFRNKHLFSAKFFSMSKFNVLFGAVLASILPIVWFRVSYSFEWENTNLYDLQCQIAVKIAQIRGTVICLWFSFFGLIAQVYLLRNSKDNFFIKEELFSLLAVVVVSVVIYTTWGFGPGLEHQVFFTCVLFVQFATNSLFAIVGNLTLFRIHQFSKKKKQLQSSASASNIIAGPSMADGGGTTTTTNNTSEEHQQRRKFTRDSQFELFLQDEELSNVFEKFLIQEFAVENLLFLRELQLLKKSSSTEEYMARAKEIFSKYCTPTSKLQVNLSSATLRTLSSIFCIDPTANREAVENVFATAFSEISLILKQDSFKRFVFTTEYSNAWNSHISEDKKSEHNTNLGLIAMV